MRTGRESDDTDRPRAWLLHRANSGSGPFPDHAKAEACRRVWDATQAVSENIDVILAGFEAWNQEDLDAWLEVLHPDVEFHNAGVFPDFDRVYRGHDGVSEFWRAMHEPWESLRVELEQIEEERRDWVAYTFRFRAKGAESGLEVDLQFANAVRLSEGLEIEIIARRTLEEVREVIRERLVTARGRSQK